MRVAWVEEKEERKEGEPPAANDATDDGTTNEPEVLVTGSRIRGLLGEQGSRPVLTITREEIDRYGISSLGEIFSYIPQVSSFEPGHLVQSTNNLGMRNLPLTANRVTASLRGAPPGGTLILVNGRRVSRTGLAEAGDGSDGYDLGGIPLSAVERIEVLLDGASAVYGADAVGGVINVILRDDYQGTEATLRYEDTYDRKSSVKTASLTHGFSSGRVSGTVTGSWERAGAMEWNDRSFLNSFDRRPFGGTDERSSIFGGAGVVFGAFGPLPDLGTFFSAIPTGADGVNTTIADYANAGSLPDPFDIGDHTLYSSPYERTNMTGNVDFEFSPVLTGFVQARWSESRTWSPGLPVAVAEAFVPFDAPGNVFGDFVVLSKVLYDVRAADAKAVRFNRGFTAGLRGRLAGDWRYETALHQVNSKSDKKRGEASFAPGALDNALFGPNPPNLFYDSSTVASPNPPGMLEALLSPVLHEVEHTRARIFDLQADGPAFTLPMGQVRTSFGAEYRDENVDFPVGATNLDGMGSPFTAHNRYTSGYFAEVRIPLIAESRHWPLLYQLDLDIAVRHDRYSDFPEATNPRYGVLYRPFSWLMLRASQGEGYKVPTLVQLYQPSNLSPGGFGLGPGFFMDPERGNEFLNDFFYDALSQGNKDLRPERSETATAGVVLEIPFIDGLSFSFDYYDMKYLDRVTTVGPGDLLNLFPDKVIRGPKLPGDPAEWSGPVTGFISTPVNISVDHRTGYDLGMKYHLSTRWGDWTAQTNASKVKRQAFRFTPSEPTFESPPEPLRLSGSMFWNRGPLGAGTMWTYQAVTNISFFTGPASPATTRWDLQGSYDFAERAAMGGDSWWSRTLAGTRVSLTIFNLFNDEPPIFAANDFRQPDNSVLDSRKRRLALSVTAKF
jgi:outer membrane receptor protein involved in Fe transport